MEVIRVLPELRNTKMIDLGCNFGLYSLLAARFAAQVVGIDINQEFIDIANRSKELLIGVGFAFDNVVFSRRFVSSLRRGEFNSMLLACVLYHLSDKEVAYLQSYISENCTRVVVQCRPDRDKHFSSGKIVEYASANNQYGALYRPEDASEFLRKAGMSVDIYSSGELFYGETFPVVIGKK
jgi:2-polyprenyl-3-methyl-5-hydroxy-6-metoxy-1,4-benzoquinol methylase